jgi:hypothetical protein
MILKPALGLLNPDVSVPDYPGYRNFNGGKVFFSKNPWNFIAGGRAS